MDRKLKLIILRLVHNFHYFYSSSVQWQTFEAHRLNTSGITDWLCNVPRLSS